MKPQISVVMITYNMAKYIDESIKSVLDQSFEDFELLILDDCSTDNTNEIVAKYNDARVKYHKAEKNQGIPYMRNWGIELMQGKYMAILDSDDIAPPYRLKEQFDYMQAHPEIGVVGGDLFSFGSYAHYQKSLQGNENIQYRFLFRCPIANPSAMVRKSVIDQYMLRYNIQYPVCSDYQFWMELLNRTEFANMTDKPYLFYRVSHSESITTDTMKEEKINKRDSIVNAIRRLFFDRFGLQISDSDYDIFKKFYCYKQNVCTPMEYEKLTTIMNDLCKQGQKVMRRPDLWEEELHFWLQFAMRFVQEAEDER